MSSSHTDADLKLSADDYIAIQQLYARYTTTFDHGDRDGYVACFTRDGQLTMPAGWEVFGAPRQSPKGYDELIEHTEYFFARRGKRRGYHWNTSIVIEPTEYGAYGTCYLMAVRATDPPVSVDSTCEIRMALHYKDELVKQDGKWLFRRRTICE